MKQFKLLLIVNFAAIWFHGCNMDKKEIKKQDLDIYLLIGQSNMAGRAEITGSDNDSLANVLLFTGIPGHEWEKAANPLNKYSSVRKDFSLQNLGPGYQFAKDLSMANPNSKIGLVVNAKGGTSIDLWLPDSVLYNEAIERMRLALKYGKLRGVLWHQGESDVDNSRGYPDKIITLILALRKEFNNSELPVVLGQLSEDKPHRVVFNGMLQELPDHLSNIKVISSKNTSTIDSTHFDSFSQHLMGERFAEAMLELNDYK